MVTHLEWSESIGKRVRSGDWADQAISTVAKIETSSFAVTTWGWRGRAERRPDGRYFA